MFDLEDPFGQGDQIHAKYGVNGAVQEALCPAVLRKASNDVTAVVVDRDP